MYREKGLSHNLVDGQRAHGRGGKKKVIQKTRNRSISYDSWGQIPGLGLGSVKFLPLPGWACLVD